MHRDSDLRYALVLPACNEEDCLPRVLDDLTSVLDPDKFVISVGVNGSSDRTAEIAREKGVITGETDSRGYGYGCQSAVDALALHYPDIAAYIFFAADGANDPNDISRLVDAFEAGHDFVLGCRTRSRENWATMTIRHVVANRLLGAWCGLLTGRFFDDLGPMRMISRDLYERLQLREWTYGWTIEAQVRASLLSAKTIEIPVKERCRLAGQQKVSGVSWRQTLRVGAQIFAAGWRTAREARNPEGALVCDLQRVAERK